MAKLINYYPRYKEAAAIASYSYPGWHRVISPWPGPICSAIITCTIIIFKYISSAASHQITWEAISLPLIP